MKQLTMTKVLTPIAALAFAFGVQAATVTETFDTYTAGASVTNETGWTFAPGADLADDASAVTAYESGTAPTGTLLPDGVSAGANYLKLSTEDGTLFRNMDGTAKTNSVDLNAGLFVDTDVQFTITDSSDRPTPTAEDKFIIWLEDQGTATNLCVWAREFSIDGTVGFNNSSNKVYTLGSPNAIVPNAWYRLTVKAEKSVGGSFKFPAFKVYINGVAQIANEYIVDNAEDTGYEYDNVFGSSVVSGRAYLPAMASEMTSLKQVGFSGEGAIDSVAVTHDIPADFPDLPRTAITFSWDSPAIASVSIGAPFYETVTAGSILTVTPEQTFTMSVNYATGYGPSTHAITAGATGAVGVNGMEVTANSSGPATVSFTATANDTLDVTFNLSSLLTTVGSDIGSVAFAVNGSNLVTLDAEALDNLEGASYPITGLKAGTNVTVTVVFSSGNWAATITPPDCLALSGTTLTVVSRPEGGTATVTISAEEVVGPTVPVVSPGTNTVYTFASAADATAAANTMNEAKSEYIVPPAGATAPNYANLFTAVADGTTVTVELNAAGTNALETASTNAVAQVASSLSAIAAGSATTVTVSGLEPGFYYAVAYAADLATLVGNGPTGVYRTIGTAVLAEDSGEVSLNIPAKTANATAGFYRVLVFVTNPNQAN